MDVLTKPVYQYFGMWSAVWIITIMIPPGPREVTTQYRLNFVMGITTSVLATLCLLDIIPDPLATTATTSYFFVDFINMILNDFVYKVGSYKIGSARRTEYFHHIFCFFVGVMCEMYYTYYCDYTKNPFVQLMYAEVSTPFLMIWRKYKSDYLGALFVISFFLCRFPYHMFYLIPDFMVHCHASVGYGFGIPYNLLNLYFGYFILRRFVWPVFKRLIFGGKDGIEYGKKDY
jgi:hypothetical protein